MLKKMENQDVEFKEQWKDKWLEWVCGMANSNGGTIYIGVDDKGLAFSLQFETKVLCRHKKAVVLDTTGES